MTKTKSLLFTASLVLAMAFTFSCSSGDKDDGGDSSSSVGDVSSSSGGGTGGSSSSEEPSSSSSEELSSSSVETLSSSSVEADNSSSSAEESISSSGEKISSSSETLSSSSVEVDSSSSSAEEPSSSSETSSSSAKEPCTASDNTETEYCSEGTMKKYGSVTDGGGNAYKTVVIGTQTWMAENLNYDVPDNATDVCYNNKADNCTKYGRLYDWNTALTACPSDWHLPSDDEWMQLTIFVLWGTKLRSTTGWYQDYGTDEFGFSALPGGNGDAGIIFGGDGEEVYWWSATEYNANFAWYWTMHYEIEDMVRYNQYKTYQYSVRCVKD